MKLNTTQKLTHEQKMELADGLGDAIELIPNKVKQGLFLYVEDAKTFIVSGVEQSDYVFINTDICGDYKYEVKYKFAVAVYGIINRVLGTPVERVAMKIAVYDGWGNFGDYVMTDALGNPIPYEDAVKQGL
jgi:hypothetical protein